MQSVTSLFNSSLMGRNFRRFWPIWAVYTIIWAVTMPVAMLLNLLNSTRYGAVIGNNYADMVLDYSAQTQVVLNGCIGVLLAMALFSYLCSARSVGMMHSLPISRKALFITNYVSGLVMLCSTYVMVFLATGMVEASFGILQLKELWQWLWVTCGTGFFCYSFGVLCAVFAGQVLAVPVFYVILNFVAVAMYYLVDNFASVFRFGANGSVLNFGDKISWFSPLYRLLSDLDARGKWIDDGENYFKYLDGKSTVVIYIVAGVAVTFFAFAAYLRRKSESASDVVAVGWAKPVFKYGVAFCMAFTTGLGMYHLFIKSFLPGYENSIPGAVLCLVFAGLVGYYIAEMLVQKSFKVLRKGFKGALVAAVGIAAISLVMTLDITGFDTYIPDRAGVTGGNAYINGTSFHMDYNGTQADVLDDIHDLHAAIIANRDEQKARAADWAYGRRDDLNYCYVSISYYSEGMKEVVDRRYEVYCLDEELSTPGTVGFAVGKFLYNKNVFAGDMLNHNPEDVRQILGGRFEYLDVEGDYIWRETELTEEQAREIYLALLYDVDALTYERVKTFDEINTGGYASKECNLTFHLINQQGDSFDAHVNLRANAKKTLEALYTTGVLPEGVKLAQWSDKDNDYKFYTYETTVAVEG